MKSEQLNRVREACKEQLLDTLMTLVRENGVDYNDYYRNEHGIDEDDGYTIVKVFDIACFGCHMALPLKWCDDIEGDTDPTPTVLADEFGYHAYWSLYIERDETNYETLMLYQFYNSGVNWQSELAEPDHHPASDLSLAELDYLTEAIYWHLHREIEKNQKKETMEKFNGVTEPTELEFYSIEEDGQGGKQVHLLGYTYGSEDNGDGAWRGLEPCGILVPLDEFIKGVATEDDYTDRLICEAKQYEGDYTDEGIMDYINHYFDGKPADYRLHYSDITMDTPCGNYVA